jgi:hypothetical protein
MTDDGARGGWRLHLICTVCRAEDEFRGFVMIQAADAARAAGWDVDTAALHVSAHDRYALCPDHREKP